MNDCRASLKMRKLLIFWEKPGFLYRFASTFTCRPLARYNCRIFDESPIFARFFLDHVRPCSHVGLRTGLKSVILGLNSSPGRGIYRR